MNKRAIVSLALGDRYVPLIRRQQGSFNDGLNAGADHLVWVNELPVRAPRSLPLPLLAYCAKPFALLAAWRSGYDVLLWLDSACYGVRSLDPLWRHIEANGHYVQENGWKVGEWCSDAALGTLKLTRDEAFAMPEISTMALGLDMRKQACVSFLEEWAALAADGVTFHGAHTNDIGPAAAKGVAYREVGHVSDDPRVSGHRHDQTAAAVLSFRRGWEMTPRPQFVAYASDIGNSGGNGGDERTLILNKGAL